MTRHSTSSVWINTLGELFRCHGVAVEQLFSGAGIDLPGPTSYHLRVPTEKVSMLWDLAVDLSRDPGIALKLKPKRPLPSFDALGYAMLSSPSLIAGLERLSRFLSVVSSAAEVSLEERDGQVAVVFRLYGGSRCIPRQRFEFDLLCLLEFFRWIMDGDLDPVAVELAQALPASTSEYAEAFACPVRFDASQYCILFNRAQANRPVPTSNPALVNLHDSYLEECIDRLEGNTVTKLIKQRIVHMLPEGEPQRAKVAHALHMSERTLQRHLMAEGSSFSEVLDEVRRELSVKYLRQRRLDLIEISCLLGFNGQSNFSRAFRRWFNTSPKQFRESL